MGADKELPAEPIMAHVKYLTEDIGIRVAGTAAERKAAKYMERQLRSLGLSNVRQETFSAWTGAFSTAELSVRIGKKWRSIPVLPFTLTKSTPRGGIEAEIVYLGQGTLHELKHQDCQGKIGLLWGQDLLFGDSGEWWTRLCDSGLVALLEVDSRMPVSWPVSGGLSRRLHEMRDYCAATVSYFDGWEMVRNLPVTARLNIKNTRRLGKSQNVIGEIPGSDPKAPIVVISGHLDSVHAGPGSDDNATGIAAAIELARHFRDRQPRATLRFIGFGAEEQLSEGAKFYLLDQCKDHERIHFVLNNDGPGSWAGMTMGYVTGTPAVKRFLSRHATEAKLAVHLEDFCSPFSDQAPFNMVGVPSIWVTRQTGPGSYWHHHSPHQTMAVVSPEVMRRTLAFEAAVLEDVANDPGHAFPRQLSKSQQRKMQDFADRLYGAGLFKPV